MQANLVDIRASPAPMIAANRAGRRRKVVLGIFLLDEHAASEDG